jgi:hypothetical protein
LTGWGLYVLIWPDAEKHAAPGSYEKPAPLAVSRRDQAGATSFNKGKAGFKLAGYQDSEKAGGTTQVSQKRQARD